MISKSFIFHLGILSVLVFLSSCQTLNQDDQMLKPPKMSDQTPLPEMINAALTFGDRTLLEVNKKISKRKLWKPTSIALRKLILDNYKDWSSTRLVNALSMYRIAGDDNSPEVFSVLVRSDRRLAQQLVWYMAAQLPSPKMRHQIESILTEAIVDNQLGDIYQPYMADALASNQMKESYSIVRRGLFITNHSAFVRAMSALEPQLASKDFLEYLAQAPIEELRQLNLKSVDVLACTEILTHMMEFPPEVSHPEIKSLFHFAVSRNAALSQLAKSVIQSYLPTNGLQLAQSLTRLPPWLQIAAIEGIRRNYSPSWGVFLGHLKDASAQKEVINEINSIIR